VIEFDATNYHALANLTRYLYLSGQFDEAQAIAAALKSCGADDPDSFLKKAETFALVGDWEAVRQAMHDGQRWWASLGGMTGLADHLAGVALANLGDLKAAKRHWRKAAAAPEAVGWAKENLNDSKRSAGKRHGPWAFPLEHWVPRGVIEKLGEVAAGSRHAGDDSRRIEQYFVSYPQLELLADAILQRSDPDACETLIRLAALVKRPAIFAALKRFACGQRGSDDLRTQALMMLSQAGYIEGPVEIWCEGTLHAVTLAAQEIYCEPNGELPPDVNDRMLLANEAIREGRGAEAERLLDETLRLRPGDVSAQFNRALAIGLQGREKEALEIVRRIHRDQPDYLFARVHLAENCIAAGDLEQAQELLDPIANKPRLHSSEYVAWCSTNINLALASGDRNLAHRHLKALEQIFPNDHRIKVLKGRIRAGRGLIDRLSRFQGQAPGDTK